MQCYSRPKISKTPIFSPEISPVTYQRLFNEGNINIILNCLIKHLQSSDHFAFQNLRINININTCNIQINITSTPI